MDNEKKQLSIDLRPEMARGCYSNLTVVTHSHSEFVLDFVSMLPGLPKPEVCSRIIMSPEHCKRLLNTLAENISKYESQFGRIDTNNQPKATFNLNDFNPNGPKS